jgi:hypothetical protein
MDQIKTEMELAQQNTQDFDGERTARDVKTLSDLEMVLVGGGEIIVCW